MGALIDLTGQVFGALTVLGKAPTLGKGYPAMWECLCECGNTSIVRSSDLRNGRTKSCGCGRTPHGEAGQKKTRLYRIWSGMKTRCHNEIDHMYRFYGAKGIEVCDEWRNSFESFRDWAVSNGYREDLTLDRKESSGNYSPENCRWATYKEQENNRSNNRLITHNGRTQTLSQWAAETGIHRGTIQYRLNHGWSVEKALNTRPSSTN